MSAEKSIVQVWTDIICPWCYIGKWKFEQALALHLRLNAEEVEVTYRSFELMPDTPDNVTGTTVDAMVASFGMSRTRALAAVDRAAAAGRKFGLEFDYRNALHANTRKAHVLSHLAKKEGLQQEFLDAVTHAYFAERRNIGDPTELVRTASRVGLLHNEAHAALSSPQLAEAVRDDEQAAAHIGIRGVPGFVVNGRYIADGSQDVGAVIAALPQRAS